MFVCASHRLKYFTKLWYATNSSSSIYGTAMSNDQALSSLQAQLAHHRESLSILLQQVAIQNWANAPVHQIKSIAEARREIARIKRELRAYGLEVEDLPDDAPRPQEKAIWQRVRQH